jgi:hypothetical protein
MLGKFLLTAAVILVALVYLQKRRIADLSAKAAGDRLQTDQRKPAQTTSSISAVGSDYRLAAWMFLALMLGTASTLYGLSWQDANKEVSVMLHRDGNASPVVYRVLKKDLSQRSFTTVEGTLVTVSANERMEVIGL